MEVIVIGLNVNEGKLGHVEARRKFINWLNNSNYYTGLEFYKIDLYTDTDSMCIYKQRNCISLSVEYSSYYVTININGNEYLIGICDNVNDAYSTLRSAISEINYCYNEHMTKKKLDDHIRHLYEKGSG